MSDALIGYTGFVGSTLLRQRSFDATYRSSNISDIAGLSFGTVVCAGAPAQKWMANREPEADRRAIEGLIQHLDAIQAHRFVLVSTVDVFSDPQRVSEECAVDESDLHPYGKHRRLLERFVAERFDAHLIVRLPGLVGPGLRKNVIFDLLNENNIAAIDSRSVFQFYPMVSLWSDIEIGLAAELDLIHLTAEPVSVATLAKKGFGRAFDNQLQASPASYDMRSRYSSLFGSSGAYQYSARETLLAVRAYVQSERLTNHN
jgi:dTDP-4-dehydrorhamnose reductase